MPRFFRKSVAVYDAIRLKAIPGKHAGAFIFRHAPNVADVFMEIVCKIALGAKNVLVPIFFCTESTFPINNQGLIPIGMLDVIYDQEHHKIILPGNMPGLKRIYPFQDICAHKHALMDYALA